MRRRGPDNKMMLSDRWIGEKVRARYDEVQSKKYRSCFDETESETRNDNCRMLKEISGSFGRQILALDLGCGTGRYFHCLENVDRLVGVDVSLPMLREARRPVNDEDISVGSVNLVCANLLELASPARVFDLIYSIGVLGEHSPFDLTVCDRLHRLLNGGGKLLLTVADSASRSSLKMTKTAVARVISPLLPASYRVRFEGRWRRFSMNEAQVMAVLRASEFVKYEVVRQVSASPNWKGVHFVVHAERS